MQHKVRNVNVKIGLLLTIMFACQSSDKNNFPFGQQSDCIAFNVFKKTQIQPTTGHTYIFKSNGEFYNLEYNIEDSIEVRHAESKEFFKPSLWKVKGDSILIENNYYKFTQKSKNEIILSKENYDTLLLEKISKKFDLEFFVRKPSFIYTVNSNGDTIRKTEIKNL